MTVAEMHREFKISYDIIDSSAYPELLDAEIDFYLNEAMNRFIKKRYDKNNLYRKGFEEMQKRTEDLKALVVSRFADVVAVPSYTSIGDLVYRADVSALFDDIGHTTASTDKYMFYLKMSVDTCSDVGATCCGWNRVNLVQHDDLSTVARDPFNKPSDVYPIVFFEDQDIFIWTGKTAIARNVLITFLRTPLAISLGNYGVPLQVCELSDHTHKEIVQMAVQITIENLQSPRVQTNEAVNVDNIE